MDPTDLIRRLTREIESLHHERTTLIWDPEADQYRIRALTRQIHRLDERLAGLLKAGDSK